MQPHAFRFAASRTDIARIVGTSDERLIDRIAATQATNIELLEAYLWLEGDEQLEGAVGEPAGRLARVIDILTEEQDQLVHLDD